MTLIISFVNAWGCLTSFFVHACSCICVYLDTVSVDGILAEFFFLINAFGWDEVIQVYG